jgi:high-affinity Fe2+/Pb2+ permease
MNPLFIIVVIILLCVIGILSFLFIKERDASKQLFSKFPPLLISKDNAKKIQKEIESLILEKGRFLEKKNNSLQNTM